MHLVDMICLRSVCGALLLASTLALAGCSGKASLNPVKGTVLYKDAPAGGVVVTLRRVGADDFQNQPSTGSTDDDGNFTISTGPDEGAPEGEYVVTCIWMQDPSGNKKKPGAISMNANDSPSVDKLKGRYADRKKPAVSNVTIKKGVNQLEPIRLQ